VSSTGAWQSSGKQWRVSEGWGWRIILQRRGRNPARWQCLGGSGLRPCGESGFLPGLVYFVFEREEQSGQPRIKPEIL